MSLVRGNVRDFTGSAPHRITSGSVKFTLVAPPQTSHVPVSKASGNRAPVVYDVDVEQDGSFSAFILANDQIRPAGTVYHVTFLVPNVSVVPRHYKFEGDGIVRLVELDETTTDEQRSAHEASLPLPVPEPERPPDIFLTRTEVEYEWSWDGILSYKLHAHYNDGSHEVVGSYLHMNKLDAARQGLISRFRPGPGQWRGVVK